MKRAILAVCAIALTIGGLASPAGADPAKAGGARGYGANANLAGTAVIDEGGLAEATLPPTTDDTGELILLPADPAAISGTFTGKANAHIPSEVPSALTQVAQTVPGPYNLRAVGAAEELQVLLGPAPAAGLPDLRPSLVSATAVRAEAVGVCRAGAPVYDADSEIIDLTIGDTAIPLNAPLTDLIDAVETLVDPLASIVDVERNQVVVTAQGASVTALHVSVLSAVAGVPVPGAAPLVDLVVGRAEVAGLACGPLPQCSDTQDNDGDGVIDANDPGCINNGVYDPNDNDETDPPAPRVSGTGGSSGGGALARTGGETSTTVPLAIGMGVLALGALALRRRSAS